MLVSIVSKKDLNSCWSSLQYTNHCQDCDKIFSCKIKSQYHVNGLVEKEKIELDKILKEKEVRLFNLKSNIEKTIKNITP